VEVICNGLSGGDAGVEGFVTPILLGFDDEGDTSGFCWGNLSIINIGSFVFSRI
jgi:hypothetical protein